MQSVQLIKQALIQAITDTAVFDTVVSPSDDRRGDTVMREPAAAVYFNGLKSLSDGGYSYTAADFTVDMKFLKIGINDTSEDIQTVTDALMQLEPVSIRQGMQKKDNGRSAVYTVDISFAGCRQ